MRYTFEICDKKALKKSISWGVFAVIAVAVLALACNVLLTGLRNASNHYVMLILNIAVDIAALYFAFWFVAVKVMYRVSVYRLLSKASFEYSGQVKHIAGHTTTVGPFQAVAVELLDGRSFFLPTDIQVDLKCGDHVTFEVAANTVTAAVVEEKGHV